MKTNNFFFQKVDRYCIDVTNTNNFLEQTSQSNNVNMKKTYRYADQNSKILIW